MTDLYTQQDLSALENRFKKTRWAAAGLILSAFIVSSALCFRVNTGNAHDMFIAVLAAFTALGWAGLIVYFLFSVPAKAEAEHIRHVFSAEKEAFGGVLRLGTETLQIPKSIAIRKAYLTLNGEETALSVNARLAKKMPPDGTNVRVLAAHRYISAIEVQDEEA